MLYAVHSRDFVCAVEAGGVTATSMVLASVLSARTVCKTDRQLALLVWP